MKTLLSALLVAFATCATVYACPFCSTISQTLSEEIAAAGAVLLVKLVKPAAPPAADAPADADLPMAEFEIIEVIKGAEHLGERKSISTLYFGDGRVGKTFLIMGIDPPDMLWTTPLLLDDRALAYLKKV